MRPTIDDGALVVINLAAYGLRHRGGYLVRWRSPRTGDLVAVVAPGATTPSIKRCIAVAGERIETHSGVVETVPVDMIFVAGDNGAASIDSRRYGPVPVDAVIGSVGRFPGHGARIRGRGG